jgi:hypothetical protein
MNRAGPRDIHGNSNGAPAQAPAAGARVPLDRRRLLTAFALTPLLAGFYPAIFLAEPAIMPLGLLVAYISTVLLGIPLVLYFDRRRYREWWMYVAGGAACAGVSDALRPGAGDRPPAVGRLLGPGLLDDRCVRGLAGQPQDALRSRFVEEITPPPAPTDMPEREDRG